MKFSDLFKDKYKSEIVREYIEKLIREMAELKRKNYMEMSIIANRERDIIKIEEALIDLGIELKIDENFDTDEYIEDED